MMGPPVGHEAAAVFKPPAKWIIPLFAKVNPRGLPQPQVPVQALRYPARGKRSTVCARCQGTGRQRNGNALECAQAAISNQLTCALKPRRAALLSPHLKYRPAGTHRVDQELPFGDGQAE